jgi:P27 family predicted phage terminase small subunit
MPRPRKADAIKLAQGTLEKKTMSGDASGWTRLEKVSQGHLKRLSPEAKKIFIEVSNELHSAGILYLKDLHQIAQYSEFTALYYQAMEMVQAEGLTEVYQDGKTIKTTTNQHLTIAFAFSDRAQKIADKLGLNLTSMTKINTLPKGEQAASALSQLLSKGL